MNQTITKLMPVYNQVNLNAGVSMLIQPVADNNQIVEAWNKYTELKSKLLSASDYQAINGKQYIKKSGWRKLQTAFGISDEVTNEKRTESGKYFTYEITVKASTQNGRFSFGVGSCASSERNFSHPEHDVRSTGHTRAKNRAISDLIGGGEVTAEEMDGQAVPLDSHVVINEEKEPKIWGREYETNKISDRQKTLLTNLILESYDNDDDRQTQLNTLPSLTKADASQLIKELLDTKKVNNY